MKSSCSTGRRFLLTPLALSVTLFLAACGGGSESADPAAAIAVPPVISAQPSEQAVTAGKVATFSVTATGTSLTYQWQSSKDSGTTWVDISGATGASYTVDGTDQSLSGTEYRVVIGSAGLSVTSSPVTLTVTAAISAPVITVDVAAVSVTAGTDATFSVTASGSTLAYQWQVSADGATFTDVAGATGATFTLPAVALEDSGKTVRVAVSNSAGTVNSTAATLHVTPAVVDATIVSQPASMSTTAPSQVTFSVGAAGSPAPTYQWQKSTDGGTTWVDIAGATAASYTTPATAVADSGSLFRVNATNATATATSAPATLTVAAAPVPVAISTQPVALSVTVPSTATFSVVATGSPTPTYQWQVKDTGAGAAFANITGATSASYTTPATVAADTGKQFQVVVTNGSGSVTSAPVTLTTTSATTTGLLGRTWSAGQAIDVNNQDSVLNAVTALVGIDDSGKAIVVFAKVDPSRFTTVLYASVGTPGTDTTPASWTAPVIISRAPTSFYVLTTGFNLAVSPNGDAVVAWDTGAPCTASTHVNTGTCGYVAATRYSASSGTWEPAVLAAETSGGAVPLVKMNSAGDVAMQYQGWMNTDGGYASVPSVARRGATQSSYSTAGFALTTTPALGAPAFMTPPTYLTSPSMGMDEAGRITVVGSSSAGHYLSYVGTARDGFGSGAVIDIGSGAATAATNIAVGRNGQALALYYQNSTLGSAFAGAGSPFQVQVAAPVANLPLLAMAPRRSVVLDDGTAVLYAGCQSYRRSAASGTWGAASTLPGNCVVDGYGFATSPLADTLSVVADTGQWSTYQAAGNALVQPVAPLGTNGSGFVYGVQAPLTTLTSAVSSGLAPCATTCVSTALSRSGVGVLVVLNQYARLPAPGSSDVPQTPGHTTLWGLFLK